MTEIVRQFQEAPADSMKFTVMATWDDAPHLDEKTRAELFASIPAYQRDARTKGIPQLGSDLSSIVSDLTHKTLTRLPVCQVFKNKKWAVRGIAAATAQVCLRVPAVH
jgi:hypothetical protein